MVTVSAWKIPDPRLGREGAMTPRAGTETAERTLAPPSLTDVMSATAARAVVLERTRNPGTSPEAVVGPVQYHAEDSASLGLTSTDGTARELADVGDPRVPATIPTTAMTATTTTSIGQRRSRA
jgi:hypothetical protein